MKKTKKRVYLTRKRKAKMATKKYILIIMIGFILPNAVIGYYGARLNEEINRQTEDNQVVFIKKAKAEEFKLYEVKSEVIRTVTMYNSVEWQTDSTPCLSANMTNICEGVKTGKKYCASNAYPFGTILHVDKLGECEVVDRMNRRYPNRVDWYAEMDIERAINFGKQNLNIKEVEIK